MKILVIGLDCAAPEMLFGDEALVNVRRIMEAGCWGRLESVIPPITVPAWMCMATSRDPGSLGVYSFRNRADRSYDALSVVNARSIRELAIWDQIAREGGRSVIVGVPPSYPPRKVNGVSVGCFLTPDTAEGVTYTHPPAVQEEIERLVGDYPVDVRGFRTEDKDWLREQLWEMTRVHFEVVRHLLVTQVWDYFQFVEIGLDRVQHGFWKHHDPTHRQHDPDSPYVHVVRDYYRYLDREIGSVLELLDDDTAVLIVSDHGARALEGGFCVNEWLVREGLLVLDEYPDGVTGFDRLRVNWEKTKVWATGGYCSRVFFNVRGREPSGTIAPEEIDAFRAALTAKLEALEDDRGAPMGNLVFRPDEVHREVKGVAPDLLVHFGALAWRAVGGVGYDALHVQENDTGPDDCNHAQFGAFALAASGLTSRGELEGVHLLEIAPTLLALGGYDIPDAMQGRPFAGRVEGGDDAKGMSSEQRDVIRDRLSGLGYF